MLAADSEPISFERTSQTAQGDDTILEGGHLRSNEGPGKLPDIPDVPWFVPIALALAGCVFTAASYIFMKCAHNRAASRRPTDAKRSTYCDIFFIFGFILLALGSVVNTVALGFGNQVLLASMGSITIILNCILSMFFLKESLIMTDWLGVFVICIGSTLFVFQAVADNTKYTPAKLLQVYLRFESVAFLICAFVYILGAYVMDHRLKQQLKQWYKIMRPPPAQSGIDLQIQEKCQLTTDVQTEERREETKGDEPAAEVGCPVKSQSPETSGQILEDRLLKQMEDDDGVINIQSLKYLVEAINIVECHKIKRKTDPKLNSFQVLKNKLKLQNVSMAVAASLFGGITCSVLVGFEACSKVGDDEGKPRGLSLPATWIYLGIALVLASCQLKTLNVGLCLFDEVQVVPIYEASTVLFNLFCGCIILNEKQQYMWYQIFGLLGSALICATGILIIVKKPSLTCSRENKKTRGQLIKEHGESIPSSLSVSVYLDSLAPSNEIAASIPTDDNDCNTRQNSVVYETPRALRILSPKEKVISRIENTRRLSESHTWTKEQLKEWRAYYREIETLLSQDNKKRVLKMLTSQSSPEETKVGRIIQMIFKASREDRNPPTINNSEHPTEGNEFASSHAIDQNPNDLV